MELIPSACSKWEEIGIGLGEADDDSGEFLEGLTGDDSKRLMKVFKVWLRRDPCKPHLKPATWKTLLDVFTSQKLFDVVDSIMASKGDFNVVMHMTPECYWHY